MTEQEREELIEKMAKAAWESDGTKWEESLNILLETYLREARAALAVAEPVIREQCANDALKRCFFVRLMSPPLFVREGRDD